MIESVNNEKVKYWTKLKDKKYQGSEGLYLVEGEHLVEEAYEAGVLEEVIVLDGNEFDYENANIVSESVMKKITSLTTVPRIIGVAKITVSDKIYGRVLLLDGIQDPGNMGTIIRSSVAFGVDTLVLGTGSVSIYNPKVLRASEGMIFKLNIVERDLYEILKELKSSGYKIYTTDVNDGKELKSIEFPEKTAIIIGNEGNGVSDSIEAFADDYLYIKMNDGCESLNAAVATSIILYELNR